MKRTLAPKFWPIERKTKKYTITPASGPHGKQKCIPLGIILRDMLHYVTTGKEASVLLNKGGVKVDGKIRKSKNFPVGIMDILAVGEENYRILPNYAGFYLQKIDDAETAIKPEKILSKTTIKGGKTQLNLIDGRNLLAENSGRDYGTGDTIMLDTASNAIKHLMKMKKGAFVIVTGGKNAGKAGRIEDIMNIKMQPTQVTIITSEEKIIVPQDYVFVIGENEPAIKIK